MRFPNPVAVTCLTCGQPTVIAETSIGSLRVHCGTWRRQCHIPAAATPHTGENCDGYGQSGGDRQCSPRPPSSGGLKRGSRQLPVHVPLGSMIAFACVSL